MVFIGGWRSGRPRYYPYARRGYGSNSCLRDLCLIQSGCCLAESLGCGPELTLLAPSFVRRSWRAARLVSPTGSTREADAGGLAGRSVRFLVAAIELYQQEISAKRRRPCCPYEPSCSNYTREALVEHGLGSGLWLSARRLLRCRPGTRGGSDPVPATDR